MGAIVHDDYPWIIPFWVRLIGVPLHLWTETNLKAIGSRLGYVHQDSVELLEGRMRVDVDTRKPLKFSRKAESPEGDEVTIEVKYEMLFKHCSGCGLLSHEKDHCPSNKPVVAVTRSDVFTRVQIPTDGRQNNMESDLRNFRSGNGYGNRLQKMEAPNAGRRDYNGREYNDRVLRRRDENPRNMRYKNAGPYPRPLEATWRVKQNQSVQETNVQHDRYVARDHGNHTLVSYGRTKGSVTLDNSSREIVSKDLTSSSSSGGKEQSARRLASTIVTPSRQENTMEENVTKRSKEILRSLSFDNLNEKEQTTSIRDEQMIDALTDIEMEGDEIMNDDLLGLDLAEMEENVTGEEKQQSQQLAYQNQEASLSTSKDLSTKSRNSKHGHKQGAPLSIQTKKFGVLRGSPHKKSYLSHESRSNGVAKSRRHHSHKKHNSSSTRNEGSMGSKNPSHLYK